jgi:hypothetical protein
MLTSSPGAHGSQRRRSASFCFDDLLDYGARLAETLQLVIPHTVGVELDGLKANRSLTPAQGKALRYFLADYGLRRVGRSSWAGRAG